MSSPKRIQRKRAKGWRMPDGAVYVGRPTKWGNPFAIGDIIDRIHYSPVGNGLRGVLVVQVDSVADAAEAYRRWINGIPTLTEAVRPQIAEIQAALVGRDLCCWCPEGSPCHADVLLELANGELS